MIKKLLRKMPLLPTLLKIILSKIGAASECLYPLLMLPNLLQKMCCALEADPRIEHHEFQVQDYITTHLIYWVQTLLFVFI